MTVRRRVVGAMVPLLMTGLLLASPVNAQSERVPEADVVDGVPRGLFVGRSLLTGRAICLLFLSNGRITRFIPAGGLDRFDWARHRADHGGDSGTWSIRGDQLRITWGDGGVHDGPLKVTPNGIEFYGKRYARPSVIAASALAGTWEAARGSAIAGGSGVNAVTTLTIGADATYRWSGVIGGVVTGRAVASEKAMAGTITVSGPTITLRAGDGTVTSHTFLPLAGNPVTAFTLDADAFTRVR
jgi:hypothetical protein